MRMQRSLGFIASRQRLNVRAQGWRHRDDHSPVGFPSYHWQGAKFVRFDDNMREVAVTEGDKVAAEAKFGYSVDAYGISDLFEYVDGVSDEAVSKLCAEYEERYNVAKELRRTGAR